MHNTKSLRFTPHIDAGWRRALSMLVARTRVEECFTFSLVGRRQDCAGVGLLFLFTH